MKIKTLLSKRVSKKAKTACRIPLVVDLKSTEEGIRDRFTRPVNAIKPYVARVHGRNVPTFFPVLYKTSGKLRDFTRLCRVLRVSRSNELLLGIVRRTVVRNLEISFVILSSVLRVYGAKLNATTNQDY